MLSTRHSILFAVELLLSYEQNFWAWVSDFATRLDICFLTNEGGCHPANDYPGAIEYKLRTLSVYGVTLREERSRNGFYYTTQRMIESIAVIRLFGCC
jgi:hypothetical protein